MSFKWAALLPRYLLFFFLCQIVKLVSFYAVSFWHWKWFNINCNECFTFNLRGSIEESLSLWPGNFLSSFSVPSPPLLIGKFDQVFAQQMSITMLVMDFSHFQHNFAPVQHSPSQNRRFRLKSYNHLL